MDLHLLSVTLRADSSSVLSWWLKANLGIFLRRHTNLQISADITHKNLFWCQDFFLYIGTKLFFERTFFLGTWIYFLAVKKKSFCKNFFFISICQEKIFLAPVIPFLWDIWFSNIYRIYIAASDWRHPSGVSHKAILIGRESRIVIN